MQHKISPTEYCEDIIEIIGKLDKNAMGDAVDLVVRAYKNNNIIFVAGNGGSAATATHFAADFGKNVVVSGKRKPRVMSLSDNLSSLTAYANDDGYETIFVRPLSAFAREGDLLIAISASGNSPNIVAAADFALTAGMPIIGMTGFSGGKLMEMATVPLHVPCSLYEPVEDIHSLFCHMIVSCAKDILAE